jgi:Predicted integral membrane protein
MDGKALKESITGFNAEKEISRKGCLIFFSAVIIIAALIFTLSGHRGEAIRDYFFYGDALFNGVLPYEPYNDMNWEYPPLAYLFLAIPRLFTSDPEGYQVAFIAMVTIFTLIGLYIVRQFSLRYEKNAKVAMSLYTLTVLMLIQFFFDRFDVIVAVFTLAAVYLYLEKRYTWAFLLLVVGLFIKLYPGFMLPVFLMPFLVNRDIKAVLKHAGTFIIACVVLIIPFIIWSPDTFLTFVSYHSDRGIQLESIAASIILFLEMLGMTSVQTVNEFWSFGLSGGLADIVAPLMMPLMVIMMGIFCIAYYIQCRNTDEDERHASVAWASFALIMVFVVFNKVFSAQYMLWIMTLLIPLMMFIDNQDVMRRVYLLFLATIITTLYFGLMYNGLNYHEPFAVMMLLIRNILIVALTVMTIRYSNVLKGLMDTIRGYIGRKIQKSD